MADTVHPQPEADEPTDGFTIRLDRRTFFTTAAVVAGGAAMGVGLDRGSPRPIMKPAEGSADKPIYDPETAKLRFVVNTSKCIGCGLCVVACKAENRIPDEAAYNRTWVERHVLTEDGTVHIDSPEAAIAGFRAEPAAPNIEGEVVKDSYFVARLCMQCENPPCVDVCPVSATYSTPEGIVLVDESRCIGCGYCVTACPYGARYVLPAGQRTPLGAAGVADKCTWCYHRITRGLEPACVEVCPVDARTFGNAADPNDPICQVLAENPEALWPDYNTKPQTLYLGPITEEA